MAKSKFQASRGTFDILPSDARQRAWVENTVRETCARAGYAAMATPIFEETELFERGVGRSTDIVNKEMFTFEDKGGRSLTLRPEGTAPICRAYIEHGMHKLAQPVKLFYAGPFFRHERPQAGRYRQFHQLGIEAIGTALPIADAEVIILLAEVLAELGVPGVELRLGSLASFEARSVYLEDLKDYLRLHEAKLPEGVRERIDVNPLRAFDSSHEGTQEVMEGAPTIIGQLSDDDADHFDEVRRLLDVAEVPYTIDPTLVRGLDYYSRTVFSFVCDRLGAQSEIGGGGRYDGLIEQLGGPATPAIGWALGVERVLLALDKEDEVSGRDVFVAIEDGSLRERAWALTNELRRGGFSTEIDLGDRGLNGQIKHADRIGARWVLILESGGSAQLRDMWRRDQRPVDSRRIIEVLRGEEA